MSHRMHSITRMPGINTDILNDLSIEYVCNMCVTNKIHNLHHLWLLLTGTWYSWESVYDFFFFHSIIQE